MQKHLISSTLVIFLAILALPVSASAHDGWRREGEEHEEWREHRWHDHNHDDDLRWLRRHEVHYVEPVYAAPTYYYPQQQYYSEPVYVQSRSVYVEKKPVFSFFFGR